MGPVSSRHRLAISLELTVRSSAGASSIFTSQRCEPEKPPERPPRLPWASRKGSPPRELQMCRKTPLPSLWPSARSSASSLRADASSFRMARLVISAGVPWGMDTKATALSASTLGMKWNWIQPPMNSPLVARMIARLAATER